MGTIETKVKSSFERLAAINRIITTSLDFNEALRLIVDNAAELFAADNSLLLLAETDGMLRVKAAHADSKTTTQFSGPMEESVIRDLARHLKLDSTKQLATAPIVTHGSVNGFLTIVRESQLTAEEQWQLCALADQAAIALNNARLHEFQTSEVMRQRDESLAALRESNQKINNILESITDLYFHILVIDDSPETTEMLCKLLQLEGAFVDSAASSAEALQVASKKRFDLIISDISMPEMDGYQLLSRLRELPEMAGVPAVALTGYGRTADIERAKEEGFAEHLTKPLDIDRLLQVVRKLTD